MIQYPIQVSNELPLSELKTIRKDLEKKGVNHGIAEIDVEDDDERADENGKLYVVVRELLPGDEKDKQFMEAMFRRLPKVPKKIVQHYQA